jgi:hypothetical protein
MIAAKVSPGAAQDVEIMWKNTGTAGNIVAHERTLTLYKSSNISEASATTDTTATNTTSDALLDSMTLTPGAGDYLALFSSSYLNGTGAAQAMFSSLYVNSVQTGHTERQPVHEGSLDNTDIPMMTNGVVSPGASQAVEVQWRGGITETRTAHERTFVLIKEAATNNTPTITSVTDSPDPVTVGSDVTFSVDWNDADAGENIKVKICKTDALSAQNCTGGVWATSTAFTTSDPEAVSYTSQSADVDTSPNSYYAFVCDDGAACSTSSSGTFTVNAVRTAPDVKFR